MNSEKYLMNPETGSVDTESNWLSDMKTWEMNQSGLTPQEQFDSLIEVEFVNDEWVAPGAQ